eukprot:TRINITY_DN14447_c0_g1_i1.p1 TRINITY_DN14447_c0_g1~~TRINITY_DN14447_c0_g1_i1.p1  ORF type:complete len:342 (+),score=42.09 TRINITY_DN14447_c0_g1_i1:20-1045(+)
MYAEEELPGNYPSEETMQEEPDLLEPKEPSSWKRWCQSSPEALKTSEESIFSLLHRGPEFSGRYVRISDAVRIWTRELEPRSKRPTDPLPLVMIHGMGAGMALYGVNAETLAENRKVILMDLPGFARSSRPEFSEDPVKCESEYISYIDQWRIKMQIDTMNLLGHSFGGFLSAAYALKHPSRVKNLILVDPWGMPCPPQINGLGYFLESVLNFASKFTPLLSLRMSGILGLNAIKWLKNDLLLTWKWVFGAEDETILAKYLYHCNSHKPTGEYAFTYMNEMFIWARHPMIPRICDLDAEVNLTTLYGMQSWVMNLGIEGLAEARNNSQGFNRLEVGFDKMS